MVKRRRIETGLLTDFPAVIPPEDAAKFRART
jgi:hypothetical protein